MRVIGLNRTGTGDYPDVDELARIDALTTRLPEADAIVISLPLTDATRGLIDAAAIA